MYALQLVPGVPNVALGGAVFIVMLIVVLGILYQQGRLSFGGAGQDAQQQVAKTLHTLKGDADALALLPYDDGTFYFKPCNFDKELIGGQGGYETEDGDKIALAGDGEAVREMHGVPIVLGVDPTEHAGAVEPVKAMMAYKNELGEYLKVDREGNVIEVGESLMPTPETEDTVDIGPEASPVVDEAADEIQRQQGIRREQALEYAIEELEKAGEVTKIMDFSMPAAPAMTDGGALTTEQATHVAVDQSKGADLLPKKIKTEDLNTALDKARMEEYEEGKLMKYFVYGMFAGALVAVLFGGIMIAINAFV